MELPISKLIDCMQQILFQIVEVSRPLIAKDPPGSDSRRKRPPPAVITSSSHFG